MFVPEPLTHAFEGPFQELLTKFLQTNGYPDVDLGNQRFLTRSVVPHLVKLSQRFNRLEPEAKSVHAKYWKETSNPENLRLAYFLGFMPANIFRMASVWTELVRRGFRWPEGRALRGLELGAGPASGACGIAAGAFWNPGSLPDEGNWALIEKDAATLQLGKAWAAEYFAQQGKPAWEVRDFHRRIDFSRPLLPRSAPKFNLWLSSFFLNEVDLPIPTVARTLVEAWQNHLQPDSIIILVEPALRAESVKLLQLRKELLEQAAAGKKSKLKLTALLPCLGNQACGALTREGDWCHEEATWWRAPYLRSLDAILERDHRVLHFSYLILTNSERPIEEIMPGLKGSTAKDRFRLVSPAYAQGQELEFFTCHAEGKQRGRVRMPSLERGDILVAKDLDKTEAILRFPPKTRLL